MKHIVSFSGGKDSTAMLLMMIEKSMYIDEIVFCDTGIEFPEMYKHIRKVESYINRKITILNQHKPFEYYLLEHIRKNGKKGYGFPFFKNRWCTTIFKINPMLKYCRGNIEYHGIAFDEINRTLKNKDKKRNINYPLVKWEITEKQALQYCYDKGFNWDGLYQKTNRVGCWCCPLCRVNHLKILYKKYPKLWKQLKIWEKKAWNTFRYNKTLDYYETKFQKEKL